MADIPYRVSPARPSEDPYWVRLSWNAQAVESILRRECCNYGRACADPVVLHRGALGALPIDEIGRALEELEQGGFLERYVVDGMAWLWFPDTDQMHTKKYLEQDRPWSPCPAPPEYQDPKGDPPTRNRRNRKESEVLRIPPGQPRVNPGSTPGQPGIDSESTLSGTRNQEPGTRSDDDVAGAGACEGARGSAAEPDPNPTATPQPEPPDDAPRFAPLRAFAERWGPMSVYPEPHAMLLAFAHRVETERGHPIDWGAVCDAVNGKAPRMKPGERVENASRALLNYLDTEPKAAEFREGDVAAKWRKEGANGNTTTADGAAGSGGGAGKGVRSTGPRRGGAAAARQAGRTWTGA